MHICCAYLLLRQTQRLIRHRIDNDLPVDQGNAAWVLAKILASAMPSRAKAKGETDWHGLDAPNLFRALRDAGIEARNEDTIWRKYGAPVIEWPREHEQWDEDGRPRKPRPISGDQVGRILKVGSAERQAIRGWMIIPFNLSRMDLKERSQERHRRSSADYMRRKREGKHRPRWEITAEAEAKRQFCKRHKISRNTLAGLLKEGKAEIVWKRASAIVLTVDITSEKARSTRLHSSRSSPAGHQTSMQDEAASGPWLQEEEKQQPLNPDEAARRLALSSLAARTAIPLPTAGAGVPFGNNDLRSDLIKDSVRGDLLRLPEDGVGGPGPEPNPAGVTPSMTVVPRPSAFAHPAIVRKAATE